ncbi:MAG: peptidylprolyl isomerase [Bacteroidota bacterium]
MKNLIPFVLFLALGACEYGAQEQQKALFNQYADDILRQIYTYQDERNSTDLIPFLKHEEAVYREQAALAFGSVQDTLAIVDLGRLLRQDDSVSVRIAAAYALGQMYDAAAQEFLMNALQQEDSAVVRKELLEALGKCITQENLPFLALFPVEDHLETEGLAWGLYRAGIRNVHDDSTVQAAVHLLNPEFNQETRLGAAHFLYRSPNLELTKYREVIINSAIKDRSAFVRMAATLALGKVPTEQTQKALTESIVKDADYRVRINALRALSAFDAAEVNQAVWPMLQDENINVGIAATTWLDRKLSANEVDDLTKHAEQIQNWRIKSSLWATAMKLEPEQTTLQETIQKRYNDSDNPYEKAALLTALSASPSAYDFLKTETFSTDHAAIRLAGMQGLASMRRNKAFPGELAKGFTGVLEDAFKSADLAMIGTAAGLITDEELDFKSQFEAFDFLYEAKSSLELPKDNEALQALQRAIDYFEGNEAPEPVKNEFNHPIDWTLVASINENHRAVIKTNKGDITLRILIDDAPGSAANFVQLARSGYYDGKNFHRVVPNFVAQGGCNRGDGWGSEDYSIRSELGPIRYREGHVGMASAGKDTEGTQWFITHSPTPHLDGRYSIFAVVVEGMDVVHSLEMGDIIEKIEIAER